MSIDKEKLLARAKTIVMIPEHYQLEMEDNMPEGDEKERCFIWEDPANQDNTIEITLDLVTGHLTRLAIDREGVRKTKVEAKRLGLDGEASVAADEFVAKHAPYPEEYTSVLLEKRKDRVDFTFREEVGGLPLPGTGCWLTLDTELNVVRYHINGGMASKARKPEWPPSIVDADTVMQDIRSNLRMELTIVSLDPSMYEMKGTEQEYRLVYEPILDRNNIDAVTGRDLFGPEHYVMPPSHPLLLIDTVPTPATDETVSWEQRLGINLEHYVLEKSTDDGERIRSLYQLRGQEEEEENPERDPLSRDAYMERKWGDNLRHFRDSSIMVQLEKTTRRLVGYHWLDRGKEGAPALNREQCWKKAEQFLRIVFPDYIDYLQLENDEEKSDGEPCEREFFYLPVYIDGIPVNHERITISVSTSTGDICNYMGVSYEMITELAGCSFLPILTSETAFDDYVEQMKLHLRWYLDHDQEVTAYRLLYEPTTTICNERGEKRTLRYIDAVSGEPIWGK
ncbi:YcdB/YcdC domain-containing protein [Paenibacillus sp. FA6]|uniref:YcdB/YcdC domain-containing protein n=1 Tax=Paenibacillus sp. FA6 TaxID=3413029 RepID=UPI003F65916E